MRLCPRQSVCCKYHKIGNIFNKIGTAKQRGYVLLADAVCAMVAPVKNPPYQSQLALHPIQSPLYLI